MNFKFNYDKKKEFDKKNFIHLLKDIWVYFFLGLILADFFNIFEFYTNSYKMSVSFASKLLIFANIVGAILAFIIMYNGMKKKSAAVDFWELEIKDDCLVSKNSVATRTYNFSDFKKFKKEKDSITFYLKGLNRFYINWDCFYDSENLKSELKNIASRIKK